MIPEKMQEVFNSPEAFAVLKGRMMAGAVAKLANAKKAFKEEKKTIKALTHERYKAICLTAGMIGEAAAPTAAELADYARAQVAASPAQAAEGRPA